MTRSNQFSTPEPELVFPPGLTNPYQIQHFLDEMPYIAEERNRSPLDVLRDGQCHCLDGALTAAAALRRIGFAPLVMELWPEPGTDDDHVLALYRVDGLWGALAKSNYAGLRFREPVHRTLRELAITYLEYYYSLDGIKTLRQYTRPLDLSRYDSQSWETDENTVAVIEKRLHNLRRYPLFSARVAANLSPVDERTYTAGMHGTNVDQAFGKRENP